jgi:hypothetical protein
MVTGAPGMIRTCGLLVRRLTQLRILLAFIGRDEAKKAEIDRKNPGVV